MRLRDILSPERAPCEGICRVEQEDAHRQGNCKKRHPFLMEYQSSGPCHDAQQVRPDITHEHARFWQIPHQEPGGCPCAGQWNCREPGCLGAGNQIDETRYQKCLQTRDAVDAIHEIEDILDCHQPDERDGVGHHPQLDLRQVR